MILCNILTLSHKQREGKVILNRKENNLSLFVIKPAEPALYLSL